MNKKAFSWIWILVLIAVIIIVTIVVIIVIFGLFFASTSRISGAIMVPLYCVWRKKK